jgi:enoyl-[acyl-carrier protein] reductase/trans-2-enoyl-CoA reductase (NAD+)
MMPEQIVEPRIRGFVCTTAHPEGCRRNVAEQIKIARRAPDLRPGGRMLVLGSSTGYGLASRITGSFGYGFDTMGVFYERPPKASRTASAGWYNTAAFTAAARAEGLAAHNINGDAFSKEVLEETIATLRAEMGPIDLLVYSIAAPGRTDPVTGEVYRSVLKPIGKSLEIKAMDLAGEQVTTASIEPATEAEIEGTVKVMGGEDLRRWVEALLDAGLMKPHARVVAYSYIGPDLTWPIYHKGTIGRAKTDLEHHCDVLHERLQREIGGGCWVSVNKSVVTQAAAAIPAVPLYISAAYKVMREQRVHEDPIHQTNRLFKQHLAQGKEPVTDEHRRIRMDDLEMRDDIQMLVRARWARLETANLDALAGYDLYKQAFRQLFGFDVEGVDYGQPVETNIGLDGQVATSFGEDET